MASSTGQRLSREDYKKKRELEELRKAGAAPPELDDSGQMINPHIPQYISEKPWYISDGRPGLHHQRQFREPKNFATLDESVRRGRKKGPVAKKWRKGACKNCGAMTHKTSDCCERIRKKGARWTNRNIQADEFIDDTLKFDFEGKRDRWKGYDLGNHKAVLEFHQKVDEARRRNKADELDDALRKGEKKTKLTKEQKRLARKVSSDSDSDSDSDDDSDEDDEDIKDQGQLIQAMDAKKRLTVRNLRIREDTAKYLRNLDVDSAHYDPKTRSMRNNPYPDVDPTELVYAGDNFTRYSGDAETFVNIHKFAWDATEHSGESQQGVVHVPSNPSKTEYIFKHYKDQKKLLKTSHKKELVEKYGGAEHFKVPPKELLLPDGGHYKEYSGDGKVVKGASTVIARSKYVEDEFLDDHTAVWGSFYDSNQKKWGYACCQLTERNGYCTGQAGIDAKNEVGADLARRIAAAPAPKPKKRKRPSANEIRAANEAAFRLVGDQSRMADILHGTAAGEANAEHRKKQHKTSDPMKGYVDDPSQQL